MNNSNNPIFDNTHWTTEQLINLSNNLATAYGCGFKQSTDSEKVDNWNTERLVNLSKSLDPFHF